MVNTDKPWMNSKQVAEHIGVSQPTLRKLIREKIIPVHKINNRSFFNVIEVDNALLNQK